MKVRKFRILRLRHHVSMVELGRACGLSAQRISELELSEGVPEQETIQKIQNGCEFPALTLLQCIKFFSALRDDRLKAALDFLHSLRRRFVFAQLQLADPHC